ncbi:MAG TPA: argininosuccinate lyase [Syntrophales bacterium]|nr:argininosuccinate lyase [Syntrophales bacterium]
MEMKEEKSKSKKPWGGRFKKDTDRRVESFTSSLAYDRRLYPYDLAGSVVHARMLARQGIISPAEAEEICRGLQAIGEELESGSFRFDESDEDIHMAIEKALTARIGKAGEKLHTGRSRNDQVALDVRLYLREQTEALLKLVGDLKKRLVETAKKEIEIVMPGYTHLQKAQPVLLAHYLLAFWEMFDRDEERLRDCRKRIDVMPLGSAALAGTSLSLDREYAAELLQFPRISRNSMDAVSDRDFIAEFIFAASLLMTHMSRFCEDLIIWSSQEFGYVEISDAFTTGSSIMPQKKNPDVAELIRGKTGRVYGHLIAILTILKGLPMTYNRDLQEDKEPLFDTVDTVTAAVAILTEMITRIVYLRPRMEAEAELGFTTATDLAEYLVEKGVPFREAHSIVGRIVAYCLDAGKELAMITFEELKKFHAVFADDVLPRLKAARSVNMKKTFGGTSPERVAERIREIEQGE